MLTPEEFNAIAERIRNNTASAEDQEAYQRSRQQSGENVHIKLPQEPITFNIGEVKGEDVHIGDRITIEQILGQKVIYVSVDEIKTREFNPTSPYKGLKKFEPEDKDCFFGRDQFITELAKELEQTNLLLLLGASGSGKSSVVRAGLLSWLQKKWGSRLVNLTFTPDQDPFESLYGSLLRYYKQADAQIAREGQTDTLTRVVTELRQADSFWFIFIDQFEELFTTSQGEKRDGAGAPTKSDRFIASLVQLNTALKLLGSTTDCPVKIIATLRADFLGSFSPYPALVAATNKHRPLIAEMRVDELRQAIEQPAAQQGVVFETGLVEEIIKDVQGQAGYLPLLQYTLNLVWETEVQNGSIGDRTLNISTYRGLGGVRGALQKHVDQIYQALPEAERLAAQRIFLKLVEIGGDEEAGTGWKPVRRRALRSEFDSELEQRVLVLLINENLLVSDVPAEALRDRQPKTQNSTVEIAHEALLTSWETLNTWIQENRQAIALRNRLNDDVTRWQAKKAEEELWTGSKLEQVLELKQNPTFNQVMGGFSPTANQFIDASLGLRDRQLRRTRIFAGVGIALAALAGTGAIFAGYQLQQAARQRVEQYAANSEALLATNPTEALVYAISATGLSRSPFVKLLNYSVPETVERALFNSVRFSREQNVFQLSGSKIVYATFDFKSQNILTLSETATKGSGFGSIHEWDLQGRFSNELFQAKASAISPDGRWGIGIYDTQVGDVSRTSMEVELRNLHNPSIDKPLKIFGFRGYLGSPASFNFTHNGRWFVGCGRGEKELTIVDLQKKQAKKQLILPMTATSAALSSDGRRLAIGDELGKVYIWNISIDEIMNSSLDYLSTENIENKDREHYSRKNLAYAKLAKHPQQIKAEGIHLHAGRIESIAFSPNGQRFVTSSQDGNIRLWSLNPIQSVGEVLRIQDAIAEGASFSADENHIISYGSDGTVRLWNVQAEQTQELQYDIGNLKDATVYTIEQLISAKFSQDGKHIIIKAKVSSGRAMKEEYLVFDLHGHPVPQGGDEIIRNAQMTANFNSSRSQDFSPDKKRIVSITDNGQSFRLDKVSSEIWLQTACNRLRYHPILTKPATDIAKEAKATCEQYVWSKNQSSESPVAEVSTSPQVAEPVKPAKPPEVTPTPIAS